MTLDRVTAGAVAVAVALASTACGKSSESGKSGMPPASCPDTPAKKVTASDAEIATPFSRANQRPRMTKEWSKDDWRAALECPEQTTVSVEDNGSTTVGSCVDAKAALQGWKAEVGPYGAPMQVEHWRDGKRDGLSVWYASDLFEAAVGPPMEVKSFRQGVAHGPHYLFIEGALRIQDAYDGGKRSGCHYEWHKSGKLNNRGTFSGGERTGLWETFHPDGKPWARAEFRTGAIARLERFEDGKWQSASAPSRESCAKLAKLAAAGQDGVADDDELVDYRDGCMLHMTSAQVDQVLRQAPH